MYTYIVYTSIRVDTHISGPSSDDDPILTAREGSLVTLTVTVTVTGRHTYIHTKLQREREIATGIEGVYVRAFIDNR